MNDIILLKIYITKEKLMSNTFYLQDTDFSIKLNLEGNSL